MPRLSFQLFLSRLAAGKPVPGVLLLGSDRYLRQLCRSRLVDAFVPEGAREWGVARFSAEDASLDRALRQAQTLPMLVARQVIILEDAEVLESLGDKARDSVADRLSAYLDDPAPFTVLVLEAGALDERMRLFKVLSQKTLVVATELSADPEERQAAAAKLAPQMAREVGVELERAAAEELAGILNGDLARIRTELDKLAAYVGDRKRITTADVDAAVVSEKKYSIWQLADVLASRQRGRALEFLDSVLREGEAPVGVVGALAWMYRKLIQAQELPAHASSWDAVRRLGIRKETAEMAVRQGRRIPRGQLLAGLAALYEADSRLKSGAVNDRAVLEFLVAQLTA